jgi:hypothetical protein
MVNKSHSVVATFFLVLILFAVAYPQENPPASYVDKGACPFECCTYRTWKTTKRTVAYAGPNKKSRQVGFFKTGSRVRGLTGEVRTEPGKYVITKKYEKFEPGDVLWVYTPLGEGVYKVWFKGKMFEQELHYVDGPYESVFPKCEETSDCWGRLETEVKSEWWVKVKSAEGWIGWSNEPENFDNKDSCG